MKRLFVLLILFLSVFVYADVDIIFDCQLSNEPDFETIMSVPSTYKIGVIFIQFADWQSDFNARGSVQDIVGTDTTFYVYEDYYDMLFSEGIYKTEYPLLSGDKDTLSPDDRYIYGSMRDYYKEVSYDQFNLDANSMIVNDTEIIGGENRIVWITAPYDRDYYVSSDHRWSLTSYAISTASANGWYSASDSIDCFAIAYAGYMLWNGTEANLCPCYFRGSNRFFTSERVGSSIADNQLPGLQAFCHEFGHFLGLGDTYGNGSGGSRTKDGIGNFSLMATWSYNVDFIDTPPECPPHLSCIEKYQLDWLSPTDITWNNSITINDIETNAEAYRYSISLSSSYNNERFWIENRQPIGFDLMYQDPNTNVGGGLLVYRQGLYQYYTDVNEKIKLLEADGRSDLSRKYGDQGALDDFYPSVVGGDTIRYITDFSNDTSNFYLIFDPQPSHFAIFNISDTDDEMTFDVYTNAWAGTVSSNTTWEDEDVYIYDDLTIDNNVVVESDVDIYVAVGATLTCNSGSQIKFASGKRLHVYGAIDANGTSSYPVVFTRDDPYSSSKTYWYGLYIHEDGDFDLDYTEIYGACYGLRADYCTGSINHSTFEENSYGYYGYHSDNTTLQNSSLCENNYGCRFYYCDDISLTNNDISDNTNRGVYFNRTTGDMTYNTISSNTYYGVYVTNITSTSACISTTEWFDPEHVEVNNTISDNGTYGAYIGFSGYADFGSYLFIGTDVRGGFNYFQRGSSTYDIRNSNSSYTIPAECNWWSSRSNYGSVDSNPTAGSLGYSMSKPTSVSPIEKLLAESRQLELDSLYTEALATLDKIFEEGSNDPIVYPAICSVNRIYSQIGEKDNLVKKLDELYSNYQDCLVGLAAKDYSVTVLSKQRKFEDALIRSRNVVSQYIAKDGLEENAAWALFEQGLICTELENQNAGLAKSMGISSSDCFSTILTKYPSSDAAEDVREQLPDLPPTNDDVVVPEKYQLLSAYPNPFNPVTTISYEIQEEIHVEISIFDISGRLVETLISQQQNAGHYDIRWNASSYPSGVYLYQIRAGNFQQVRKMVLVK